MSNGRDRAQPPADRDFPAMNGAPPDPATPAGGDQRPAWRTATFGGATRGAARPWLLLAGIAVALSAAAILLRTPALAEAWLLTFLVLAGFGAASLGLVMIGHLLGEVWLDPVRDELEPASWTVPLLVPLAFPVAASLDLLYPWAASPPAETAGLGQSWLTPAFFLVRGLLYLALWTSLAVAVARAGANRGVAAAGLAVLAATFSLATLDWVISREVGWWSSLGPFSVAVNQLLGALAAAILVTVARQGHPESGPLASLERTLLTLALLALWVWFSQYLVVWMGNLPEEAAWFLARQGSGAAFTAVAVGVVGTLVAAIVLLIATGAGRWRVLAACVLILLHHVAYMIWLLRPVRLDRLGAVELLLVGGMLGIWAAWFGLGLARHGVLTGSRASGPGGTDGERRG